MVDGRRTDVLEWIDVWSHGDVDRTLSGSLLEILYESGLLMYVCSLYRRVRTDVYVPAMSFILGWGCTGNRSDSHSIEYRVRSRGKKAIAR